MVLSFMVGSWHTVTKSGGLVLLSFVVVFGTHGVKTGGLG